MSDGAHIALSVAVGAAAAVTAILLYFRLVVRPNVARRVAVGRQENNHPPIDAFPYVLDAAGDLWQYRGGGMWACFGDRHTDRKKPRSPLWLHWRDLCRWYGPVKWLRPDEAVEHRKSA